MRELIQVALSPDEVRALWRKKLPNEKTIKVIDYDNIIESKNINSLFENEDRLIIFYPNYESNDAVFGHYCALIKGKNNVIYFFDSYGGRPDIDQKKFSGRYRKDLYEEKENSLIALLINSGCAVDYSNYKLQSRNPKVATCGRWCLTRCAMANLNNDQFADYIKKVANLKHLTPDQLVTMIFH